MIFINILVVWISYSRVASRIVSEELIAKYRNYYLKFETIVKFIVVKCSIFSWGRFVVPTPIIQGDLLCFHLLCCLVDIVFTCYLKEDYRGFRCNGFMGIFWATWVFCSPVVFFGVLFYFWDRWLLIVLYTFDLQIINDRGVGGKCYGFVTFTNPRSAVDAISEMDGQVC